MMGKAGSSHRTPAVDASSSGSKFVWCAVAPRYDQLSERKLSFLEMR